MEERDKIYLAALLDMGSHFGLRQTATTFTALIRISRGTNTQLLELQSIFGGSIGWSKKTNSFWLNFQSRDCSRILLLVLPYLKTKVRHAQILMEFNEHIAQREAAGIKCRRLTYTEQQWRAEKVDELRTLNG